MKHTRFTIYINTDTVDIDQKCVGLNVYLEGVPADIKDHIHKNRGLHIQVRHNRDPQTFTQACDVAKLIAAAPEMLQALKTVVSKSTAPLLFGALVIAEKAITQAEGDK